MKKMQELFSKYKHAIPLILYGIIYLTWFGYLERTVTKHYQVIHMPIDDVIPFCEVFIVPYLLWFLYVAVVICFLFFKNKNDYYKCGIFLATGMTVFLIISTFWPNGHHLRLAVLPRDNIFTDMVSALWRTDTPTNLWPSIHVYNSIGAHLAVMKSTELAKHKGIRNGSAILSVSIILATVFLKQHSVFDVITAFAMAAIMYLVVYKLDIVLALQAFTNKKKTKPQIG